MTISLSSSAESGAGDSTRRSGRQRHQPNRLINDTAVMTTKKAVSAKQPTTSRGKAKAALTKSFKAVKDGLESGEEEEQEPQSAEDNDDEEEEEEEDEEEEEEEDEIESSPSEDYDDDDDDDAGDSDFEEQARKPKKAPSKPADIKGKGRAGRPKIDRIPIIRRPKERSSGSGEAKQGRASKSTKSKKSTKAGRSGALAARDNEDVGGESAIYDAIVDSQVALDMEVTQWCEKYDESSQEALLELVNLLIRSCGCTQMLTADEFEDQDNIVETLEDVLVRYKESTTNFDYPIVSKAREFKKFKKNLLEFYTRLIRKCQADILYDDTFMSTMLTWTISLSSTTFRPFRHTASVVALNLATSLVEIASELDDDLNTASRQLSAAQKTKASTAKISQLRKTVNDAQSHKKMVIQWIDEIFVSVFVMRCRDVDPLVRVECVRELGVWMAKYPDYFISTAYLRYLGWLVTDKAATVRAEALKAFSKLYELDHHHANTLRQTVTRFMERLVGLAMSDADLNVRLGAIRLLTLVDQHGQLEEEDQALLSSMIYCTNPKIRKALSKFIKTRIAEDEVAKRIAQCEIHAANKDEINKDWIELKSLTSFLIKVGKQLAAQDEQAKEARVRMIDEAKTGRVALAVEALWSDMEILKNWKTITEYLVQDHTSGGKAAASSSLSSSATAGLAADYRLEDEEEGVLLEVLVASIQLTLKPPAVFGFQKDRAKTEAQLAEAADEVGRYLVNALPQLFVKYSVDETNIQSVLVITQLFSLNVYVDIRMVSAYDELVSEVIKVYKKHVHPSVLSIAAQTLRKMQEYEMLRASNEGPFQDLCTWVLENFLVLCPSGDNVQHLDASDRKSLQGLSAALSRLEFLVKNTDMTVNKSAVVQRETFEGLLRVIRLGSAAFQGADAEMVMSAMSIGFLWISWLCRGLLSHYGQDGDWSEKAAADMKEMRDALIQLLQQLALLDGAQAVEANVRRKAFQTMGDLFWLFGSDMFHTSKGVHRHSLWLRYSEAMQSGCEQFVRAELELWDNKLREVKAKLRQARSSTTHGLDMDMDLDDDGSGGNGQGPSSSSNAKQFDEPLSDAEEEDGIERAAMVDGEQGQGAGEKYEMFSTVFSYMRQLMLKDLDMKHAVAVVAHYGRFGGEYDEGIKRVVSVIKQGATEALYASERLRRMEEFMSSVVLESLKESYELYMDGRVRSFQTTSAALAKVLTGVITPAGFMKTKRASVAPRLIWEVQRQGLGHAVDKMAGYASIDDEKQMLKMVGFFEILGHLLFGIHVDSAEVKKTQELLRSELSARSIVVREGQEWEPLRAYQTKLDKMLNKAAAAAPTAPTATTPAASTETEKRDMDMGETSTGRVGREASVTPPPPSPPLTRKRHLLEMEDSEMEAGGEHDKTTAGTTAADGDEPEKRASFAENGGVADSDNESVASQGLSSLRKETKRMKLDA